jgi:dipeptidyl aminopeptidase/acylaminoacyl peptidase
MKGRACWWIAGIVLISPAVGRAQSAASATAPRKLEVDDYFRIRDVDDPQISPEGKWVAYTVTTKDLKDDENHDRIWMMPAAGGAAIPLSADGVDSTSPRWSPDGKYLAFISGRHDKPEQVWLLNRDGGEAQQLSSTPQNVKHFAWSPSGDRIVLVLQDPTPEELEAAKDREEGKDANEDKPKHAKPWVIDRLYFKDDEVGYLDRRRTHLYVLDVAAKKMTQVTSGDYDDSQPAWSPDGKQLAFTSNRTAEPDRNYNSDIWTVDAGNTDQGKTLHQVTTNPGEDNSPAWSPDGKWIAFVSRIEPKALDYETRHLAIIPATGGEEKVLTLALDRWVIDPRFSPDGKSILFILEDDATQNVASIAVEGGPVKRWIPFRPMVTAYSISNQGTVAAVVSDPQRPPEVYLLDASAAPRRLTTVNDALMAQLKLVNVEYVHYKSKDGTPVSAFLYKPLDYVPGKRYPTILMPHGGPVWAFYSEFYFEPQLFAENGYVVITPNARGSTGYGQKFSQAILADWGDKDFEDYMAGLDYTIAQGLSDPDHLGVNGWSYGGIMTNYCITKSKRFKAAITGAGESLYITDYGHDIYEKDWEMELGKPWENRALWEKLSPFNSVQNVNAAVLIMGGDVDWNVPIINSEQLYLALKSLGRTTELVVYPGEYHEFKAPSHIKDRFERYLDWYSKYLKGTSSTANASAGGASGVPAN